VVRWIDRDPLFASADLEFGGVRRVCHMACALDADEGDYVIVHAGIAIARLNSEEAERLLGELQSLGGNEESAAP
jgi:hydrogenase expression/formation protein HypC